MCQRDPDRFQRVLEGNRGERTTKGEIVGGSGAGRRTDRGQSIG